MIMESHALFFFFLVFHHSMWPMWYVGSWFPDKESSGQPLHSECRISATGPPGKSHILKLLNMYLKNLCNGYQWWCRLRHSRQELKSDTLDRYSYLNDIWGSFRNLHEEYEEFDGRVSCRHSEATVARWALVYRETMLLRPGYPLSVPSQPFHLCAHHSSSGVASIECWLISIGHVLSVWLFNVS